MASFLSGYRSQECTEKSKSAQEAVEDEIMTKTFRRTDEIGRHKFITPHILEKIWTDERLADLFAGTELSERPWPSKQNHLKILSILVVMNWSEWSQFKAIFIDHPGRADRNLPLTEAAFDGTHFRKAERQRFVESQSQFLPATIIENTDLDCPSEFQLPFETEPEIISPKGSYCSVEKVVVASRHYRDSAGEVNANVSIPRLRDLSDWQDLTIAQPKELIRKLCYLNDPKLDLNEEKNTLSKLRNSLFDDTRVMKSLGTMTYQGTPRTLSIFFPVAQFDLDDYLFGKKSNDSIRQYPVDPFDLIKEFACLTHALDYLHNKIRLDNGEQFVCVHHDLKPDNILVVADGSPVGRWMVTDFGLSRVKQAKSKHPSTGTTLYDHVSSVRASLTSPKRKQGTFQPPEIEKVGERVMGPNSDIWGLGCVLCLVLEYAIGGVPGVERFQNRRLRQEHKSHGSSASYEHDYFYRGDQLNPEVLSALEKTSQVGEWARNCVEIIKTTLRIDPDERPKAELVENWLFERVLSELRKSNPSSTSAKPAGGPNESNQVAQQIGPSMKEDIAAADASEPESPNPKVPAIESTSSQSDNIGWRPYPPSWSPTLSSQFVTFELGTNAKQTSLSQSGEYVAFLCEGRVYVHSVALLDTHARWDSNSSKSSVRTSERTFLVIPAPENTVWKAMSVSGSFIAIRGSNRKEKGDYACVFALTLGASFKVEGERVFEKYPISKLLGILISVKGDLALLFASAYEYRSRGKKWANPSRRTIPGLKNLDFTLDGNWLLAWSDDRRSMYSHFWATKKLEDNPEDNPTDNRRVRLQPQPNQVDFAVEERMIPHATLPAFVLFDERPGRVRHIQGQIHPPKEQLSSDYRPSIRAGVVTPASNAIVLACERKKLFSAVPSLSISTLMMQQDGTLQLQNPRELYESETRISVNNKKFCDIAVRVHDDTGMIETIFISYLTGMLEKIECSLPQPR